MCVFMAFEYIFIIGVGTAKRGKQTIFKIKKLISSTFNDFILNHRIVCNDVSSLPSLVLLFYTLECEAHKMTKIMICWLLQR